MESERLASYLVEDEIDLIKGVFKACPEYVDYILSKYNRVEAAIDEMVNND